MIIATELTISDAEFYKLFKSIIPKGIYYETSKKRWRVRLYKSGRVVSLAYFKHYTEARQAHIAAKEHQRLSARGKTENLTLKTNTTSDLINTLGLL